MHLPLMFPRANVNRQVYARYGTISIISGMYLPSNPERRCRDWSPLGTMDHGIMLALRVYMFPVPCLLISLVFTSFPRNSYCGGAAAIAPLPTQTGGVGTDRNYSAPGSRSALPNSRSACSPSAGVVFRLGFCAEGRVCPAFGRIWRVGHEKGAGATPVAPAPRLARIRRFRAKQPSSRYSAGSAYSTR